MADQRVKHAKTAQRTLRLTDETWERLRCEAFERHYRTEQQLIANIIAEHFDAQNSPKEPPPLPEPVLPEWVEFYASERERGCLLVPFPPETREPIEKAIRKYLADEHWDVDEFYDIHGAYVEVAKHGVKFFDQKGGEGERVERLKREIEELKLDLEHVRERYLWQTWGEPCPTREEWKKSEAERRKNGNTEEPPRLRPEIVVKVAKKTRKPP